MIENRVRETSTSTGAGDFVLDGAIDATFTDFITAFGDGNSCFYTIIDVNGLDYEIGMGTISSGGLLSRDIIYQSSNGNSIVFFASGLKAVFNAIPSQYFTTTPGPGFALKGDLNGKIDNGWLKNSVGYDYFNVITYGGAIDIDMDNGSRQFITLTGSPTLTLTNTSTNGDNFTLAFKQDGTGGHTITWFAGITWPGGSPVQPSATANAVSYFDFIRLASGTIYFRPVATTGGGGGGGVDGPMASNLDAIAVWDDITGTLLRNSLVNIHAGSNDKLETLASFGAVVDVVDAATLIIDLDEANSFLIELPANRDIQTDNASIGQRFLIKILGGGFQVTFLDQILWNCATAPVLGGDEDSWNEIELFCYGVDAYDNPLFIELGRRGSNVIDSLSKNIGTSLSGSLAEPYYDVMILSGNATLPSVTDTVWGREFIVINGSTSAVTLTGTFKGAQGSSQENPLVLDAQYHAITIVATATLGWQIVADTRQQQVIEAVTGTVTLAKHTTYARVATGLGAINVTLPNGYKGKTVIVKKVGTGSTTIKNIGGTTLATLDLDEEICLLIYNSGWEIVFDFQPISSGGTAAKTLYSKALAAAADTLTGNNTQLPFAVAAYSLASGTLSLGKKLKLRASGTWDASGHSGNIFSWGFVINDAGTPSYITPTQYTLPITSGQTGSWLIEAELVYRASNTAEISGFMESNINGQVSSRSIRHTSVAITPSVTNTFRPYFYSAIAATSDLRTFSIEAG